MDAIITAHDGKVQMIDSMSVRVHQQAAAQKQGGDVCTGRSRGGLTTKLHVGVNEFVLPLQLELSSGPAHDAPMAAVLLQRLPKGTSLLADRADDADWIRDLIEDQDGPPVIPPKSNRLNDPPFCRRKYKQHNLIERCIGKLKQFRHIATRYDR